MIGIAREDFRFRQSGRNELLPHERKAEDTAKQRIRADGSEIRLREVSAQDVERVRPDRVRNAEGMRDLRHRAENGQIVPVNHDRTESLQIIQDVLLVHRAQDDVRPSRPIRIAPGHEREQFKIESLRERIDFILDVRFRHLRVLLDDDEDLLLHLALPWLREAADFLSRSMSMYFHAKPNCDG